MLRKIFLSLAAMLVIAVSVCAENISYDFTQNKINNTDSYSIVKKGEELYFSGEKDFVEINLQKGDKITLLSWDSYANIKPKAAPAVYNACDVIYMCDGEEVAKGIGFAEGELVYPDVPQKDGHHVEWSVSESGEYDLTANAVYTPNKYKITFDESDEEIEVTYDDKYPKLPTPENADISKYFIGWYNGEEIIAEGNRVEITENVCLVAKWEDKPAYKVTYNSYYQDGAAMLDSVIEGEKAIEPADPEKTGYKFLYWCTDASGDSKYDFETAIQRDVTLYPKWEIVYYTATFKAEGIIVAEELYTVESEGVTESEVPEKDGYDGKWETYSLDVGGVTVNAVYTPIEYIVKFMVNGVEISRSSYTVENKDITPPEVPEQEWKVGKWEEYTLETGDVTINAVYTTATYKISFKADNVEIGTQIYDEDNQTVNFPDIPAKAGHRAVWERFEVVPGGMTINVRYISAETDKENAEELYHYQNLVTDLSRHTETGTEKNIVENIILVGKGILADIEYGIIIEEEYIKSTYKGIIKSTQALNSKLTEREKADLTRNVGTAIKDKKTLEYFQNFYKKYFQ